MTDIEPTVPFANAYWVVPGLFLAGEHPADSTEELIRTHLSALLDVGIRTFLDQRFLRSDFNRSPQTVEQIDRVKSWR